VSAPDVIVLDAAVASDVDELARLHVAAFDEVEEDDLAAARRSLDEELARPWSVVRVARRGEAIAGALVAWVVADEVHVLDVATHPAHRRRGVARVLVTDLLALAHARGARHLYLEVRRSNAAAIALYRSLGFAATGVRARYYADDEDAVEMSLALDPLTGAPRPRADEVDLG
jgi:ribosomal-protein-alanine N-acetyltransferase